MLRFQSCLTKVFKNVQNKICTAPISTTSSFNIDRRRYDNQVFYDNVGFGFKRGRSNIRNRNERVSQNRKWGLQKLTRVRVVDNSKMALLPYHRSPRVIHCYTGNRKHACVGDMVLLAIRGEMKKAFVVGQAQPMGFKKARQDSNNVILLNNDGNPTGTRITVPVPSWLRGHKPTRHIIQMSKIIAITGRFV